MKAIFAKHCLNLYWQLLSDRGWAGTQIEILLSTGLKYRKNISLQYSLKHSPILLCFALRLTEKFTLCSHLPVSSVTLGRMSEWVAAPYLYPFATTGKSIPKGVMLVFPTLFAEIFTCIPRICLLLALLHNCLNTKCKNEATKQKWQCFLGYLSCYLKVH